MRKTVRFGADTHDSKLVVEKLALLKQSLEEEKDLDKIKEILKNPGLIYRRFADGETPLTLILTKKPLDNDKLNLLLQNDADIFKRNSQGKSALEVAQENGYLSSLKQAVHRIFLNCIEKNSKLEKIQEILRYYPEFLKNRFYHPIYHDITPLILAAYKNRKMIADLFLQDNISLEERQQYHEIVEQSARKELLEDQKSNDRLQKKALRKAKPFLFSRVYKNNGYSQVEKYPVSKINSASSKLEEIKSLDGETPCTKILKETPIDIKALESLIFENPDCIFKYNDEEKNALKIADENKSLNELEEMVTQVFFHCINLDEANLHYIQDILNYYPDFINLKFSWVLDNITYTGVTPLMMSVHCDDEWMVMLFLQYPKIDIAALDSSGKTAEQLAHEKCPENEIIINLLQKAREVREAQEAQEEAENRKKIAEFRAKLSGLKKTSNPDEFIKLLQSEKFLEKVAGDSKEYFAAVFAELKLFVSVDRIISLIYSENILNLIFDQPYKLVVVIDILIEYANLHSKGREDKEESCPSQQAFNALVSASFGYQFKSVFEYISFAKINDFLNIIQVMSREILAQVIAELKIYWSHQKLLLIIEKLNTPKLIISAFKHHNQLRSKSKDIQRFESNFNVFKENLSQSVLIELLKLWNFFEWMANEPDAYFICVIEEFQKFFSPEQMFDLIRHSNILSAMPHDSQKTKIVVDLILREIRLGEKIEIDSIERMNFCLNTPQLKANLLQRLCIYEGPEQKLSVSPTDEFPKILAKKIHLWTSAQIRIDCKKFDKIRTLINEFILHISRAHNNITVFFNFYKEAKSSLPLKQPSPLASMRMETLLTVGVVSLLVHTPSNDFRATLILELVAQLVATIPSLSKKPFPDFSKVAEAKLRNSLIEYLATTKKFWLSLECRQLMNSWPDTSQQITSRESNLLTEISSVKQNRLAHNRRVGIFNDGRKTRRQISKNATTPTPK